MTRRERKKRARTRETVKGVFMIVGGVLLGACIGTMLSVFIFETSIIHQLLIEVNK